MLHKYLSGCHKRTCASVSHHCNLGIHWSLGRDIHIHIYWSVSSNQHIGKRRDGLPLRRPYQLKVARLRLSLHTPLCVVISSSGSSFFLLRSSRPTTSPSELARLKRYNIFTATFSPDLTVPLPLGDIV